MSVKLTRSIDAPIWPNWSARWNTQLERFFDWSLLKIGFFNGLRFDMHAYRPLTCAVQAAISAPKCFFHEKK
jgi:hypothetical protein